MKFNLLKKVAFILFSITLLVSTAIYSATPDNANYVTVAEAKAALSAKMLSIYPVGSIFMSTSASNPATKFGGTWVQWGSGRVPAGVNTSDGNFNAVEKTGGEITHALTTAEMPSHNHSFSGSTVTTGNNSATPTATFTGGVSVTSNQSAGHTHSIPSLTGTAASAGGSTHTADFTTSVGITSWMRIVYGGGSGGAENHITGYEPGPYHDVSGNNIPSGNHSHAFSTTTSSSGNHTHSVTTVAKSTEQSSLGIRHSLTASGSINLANNAHTHSVTARGSIGNNGGGLGHYNLQPYITCYMWKRTA